MISIFPDCSEGSILTVRKEAYYLFGGRHTICSEGGILSVRREAYYLFGGNLSVIIAILLCAFPHNCAIF